MLTFSSSPPSEVSIIGGNLDATITNSSIEITTSPTSPPSFNVSNATIEITTNSTSPPVFDIGSGNIVDVNNISGGNVSVNNSVGTTIQTSSSSESLYSNIWKVPPGNPSIASALITFGSVSVPCHAAGLILSVTSQPAAWQFSEYAWVQMKAFTFKSGTNENTTAPIYDSGKQYNLVTPNISEPIYLPVGVIPIDQITNGILIQISIYTFSAGPTLSGTIDIIGYTQAIPPDPALTRNVKSSYLGIAIGDSVSPSSSGNQSLITPSSGGINTSLGAPLSLPSGPYILKSFTVTNRGASPSEVGLSGYGVATLKQLSELTGAYPTAEFIFSEGIYQPGEAIQTLNLYAELANTFRVSATWSVLTY